MKDLGTPLLDQARAEYLAYTEEMEARRRAQADHPLDLRRIVLRQGRIDSWVDGMVVIPAGSEGTILAVYGSVAYCIEFDDQRIEGVFDVRVTDTELLPE